MKNKENKGMNKVEYKNFNSVIWSYLGIYHL